MQVGSVGIRVPLDDDLGHIRPEFIGQQHIQIDRQEAAQILLPAVGQRGRIRGEQHLAGQRDRAGLLVHGNVDSALAQRQGKLLHDLRLHADHLLQLPLLLLKLVAIRVQLLLILRQLRALAVDAAFRVAQRLLGVFAFADQRLIIHAQFVQLGLLVLNRFQKLVDLLLTGLRVALEHFDALAQARVFGFGVAQLLSKVDDQHAVVLQLLLRVFQCLQLGLGGGKLLVQRLLFVVQHDDRAVDFLLLRTNQLRLIAQLLLLLLQNQRLAVQFLRKILQLRFSRCENRLLLAQFLFAGLHALHGRGILLLRFGKLLLLLCQRKHH